MTSEKKSKRLAIIGCGSSGLISLKYALDALPDWEIICFEKTNKITGCWGAPYPGFVSTSTKYTTQFACMPEFNSDVHPDGGKSSSEFFCGDEYGQYLKRFANHFNLHPHIRLMTPVTNFVRCQSGKGWNLSINESSDNSKTVVEHFDQLIIATGLAASPKAIKSKVPILSTKIINSHAGIEQINNKKIVVIGGGESAVDFADRLTKSELNNEVYLSLKSGIRVSPRYHPIRGVPSDFLRNRLMLSIHQGMRNRIGHFFVRARIRYQERFESFFSKKKSNEHSKSDSKNKDLPATMLRKEWADRLTQTAKDDLFNMFHNKSDTFLDAVGEGRIKIIGPPTDTDCKEFFDYNSQEKIKINPELIIPAIGYHSLLDHLSQNKIKLKDFYLGCTHIAFNDLHLVGFARPIIGNIPSISEVQADYITQLIAKNVVHPDNIKELHAANSRARQKRYGKLNLDMVYPVEMFPYCDHIARKLGKFPKLGKTGLIKWLKMQFIPASTIHYHSSKVHNDRIYMPWLLILIITCLIPLSVICHLFSTDKVHKEG